MPADGFRLHLEAEADEALAMRFDVETATTRYRMTLRGDPPSEVSEYIDARETLRAELRANFIRRRERKND